MEGWKDSYVKMFFSSKRDTVDTFIQVQEILGNLEFWRSLFLAMLHWLPIDHWGNSSFCSSRVVSTKHEMLQQYLHITRHRSPRNECSANTKSVPRQEWQRSKNKTSSARC